MRTITVNEWIRIYIFGFIVVILIRLFSAPWNLFKTQKRSIQFKMLSIRLLHSIYFWSGYWHFWNDQYVSGQSRCEKLQRIPFGPYSVPRCQQYIVVLSIAEQIVWRAYKWIIIKQNNTDDKKDRDWERERASERERESMLLKAPEMHRQKNSLATLGFSGRANRILNPIALANKQEQNCIDARIQNRIQICIP